MIKIISRAVMPCVVSITISQQMTNRPPLWWSVAWTAPLFLILAFGVVVDEIAELRKAVQK